MQLDLAKEFELPLFLHDRNTGDDFYNILKSRIHLFKRGGVVHSYTGPLGHMRRLAEDLGMYIGINGCSLKTRENLEVVKNVPIEKLLVETGMYV